MSLRGQLLVAGPALLDPNFHRTVVLVGDHSDHGAMGVVLDRPSAVTVADAVAPLAALTGPDELVYLGGPVHPEAVLVLAEFANREQAESLVVDGVGFLPGELDDAHALGELPHVRVFAGYAGWAPGQLEAERDEAPGSSSPPTARTSSRTIPRGSGATCFAARAARMRSWRSCPTILAAISTNSVVKR